MLKSSLYITSIYSPFNWKNAFQEKKMLLRIERKCLQCYIMIIVNSHHQGFLGEPFKIITNNRNKNDGKLFTHEAN